MADLDEASLKELGLAGDCRPVVDEVVPNAPAEVAGLRKGDVILKVRGQSATNGRQLSKIVAASKPGEILPLTVFRDSQTYELRVVLGRSPN